MDVKTKINTFLKNKQNRDNIFKSAHLDKIITDTLTKHYHVFAELLLMFHHIPECQTEEKWEHSK